LNDTEIFHHFFITEEKIKANDSTLPVLH